MSALSALDVYKMAKDLFVLPTGWDSSAWRHDIMFASGLTALAVEATLRDIAQIQPQPIVLRNPMLLEIYLGNSSKGILGCSYSGGSAEVLDGLAFARLRGLATALVSANQGETPEIIIPELHSPRVFQHLIFTAVLPSILGEQCYLDLLSPDPTLISFLESAYRSELIPIFVNSVNDFQCRILLAHWLEILRRPGFRVQFPEWTHDLLWATTQSRKKPFAFVFESSPTKLSDDRFNRVLTWAKDIECPYFELSSLHLDGPGQSVGFMLGSAMMYYELACRLDIDTETELRFDTWKESRIP